MKTKVTVGATLILLVVFSFFKDAPSENLSGDEKAGSRELAFVDPVEIDASVQKDSAHEQGFVSNGQFDEQAFMVTSIEFSMGDFLGSGDPRILEAVIDKIAKNNVEERQEWISKWPKPQNIYQNLLLHLFSLNEHPVDDLEGFDRALSEIGAIVDTEEGEVVNGYLNSLVSQADDEGDLLTKSLIYRYNASHAVDYHVGEYLRSDLKKINEGFLNPSEAEARELFKSMISSVDMDAEEKAEFSKGLLTWASAYDYERMLETLETSVYPLIL